MVLKERNKFTESGRIKFICGGWHCELKVINEGGDKGLWELLSERFQDESNSEAENENRERVALMDAFSKPRFKDSAGNWAGKSYFRVSGEHKMNKGCEERVIEGGNGVQNVTAAQVVEGLDNIKDGNDGTILREKGSETTKDFSTRFAASSEIKFQSNLPGHICR